MKMARCPTLILALGTLTASTVLAAGDDLEEVVVIGTRMVGVKAAESLRPVDVIGAAELARAGRGTVMDAFSDALPSLDLQAVGFDLANETLSVRMDGLSPNHTLVLINGKRLHGTANLAVLAGPYQGSAAPDLAFVTLSSLASVKVLRDGAAAEDGSDAIAGVMTSA